MAKCKKKVITTTLRVSEDIYDSIVEGCAIHEGRSANKMINILLAEALNARDDKLNGNDKINPMTGNFYEDNNL